ncbi:MAG: hypothetical protein ABJC63_11835 [Gemmatimonadales bacterium]
MESGGTSQGGAALGLLAASAIPFLLGSVPLFITALSEHWHQGPLTNGTLSAALALLGASYLLELGYTILVGGPTWIFLKLRRRESGASYMKWGAVGGALIAAFKYGRRGIFTGPGVVIVVMCIVFGTISGLVFWLVARERDGGSPHYTGALPTPRDYLEPLELVKEGIAPEPEESK